MPSTNMDAVKVGAYPVRLPAGVVRKLTAADPYPLELHLRRTRPYAREFELGLRKPRHECNPDNDYSAMQTTLTVNGRTTAVVYCETCSALDPLSTDGIVRALRRLDEAAVPE